MADLGFMPAVTQILDAVPAGGQRLLFSATLDEAVDRLVRRYLSDPVTASGRPGDRQRDHDGPPRVEVAPARTRRGSLPSSPAATGPNRRLRPDPAGRGPGRRAAARRRRAGRRPARRAGPGCPRPGSWPPSATARCRSWWPPTSRPAASTSTTSAWCSRPTRRSGPKEYLHRAGRTARAGGDRPGRHSGAAAPAARGAAAARPRRRTRGGLGGRRTTPRLHNGTRPARPTRSATRTTSAWWRPPRRPSPPRAGPQRPRRLR